MVVVVVVAAAVEGGAAAAGIFGFGGAWQTSLCWSDYLFPLLHSLPSFSLFFLRFIQIFLYIFLL